MPHPSKKQRMAGDGASSSQALLGVATADDLSVDVLANIFGYLDGPKDIMRKRRVCKKWKEAVKETIVPPTDFRVNSLENYNAMNVMTEAMPNLQEIYISGFEYDDSEPDDSDDPYEVEHKWRDGEDPDKGVAARFADRVSHDIEIISNFSKLRNLIIDNAYSQLNGRYPFLFNSFPLLQNLRIKFCYYLNWDLEMLAGIPLLKELECISNFRLTGNINNLRVLNETLEKVTIEDCDHVEGNLMDLADFPHLKELRLEHTAVTGDIRDIGENNFSSLELLALPKGVYGGIGYELQRISDAPDLMRTLYLFKKQRPALKMEVEDWYGELSEDSPDLYEYADDYEDGLPPFYIRFVEAGPRIGYRWTNCYGTDPCEVNWLDPEPDRESGDYAKYIEELQQINAQVNLYRGLQQPPTEEEYNRLIEEYYREEEDAT